MVNRFLIIKCLHLDSWYKKGYLVLLKLTMLKMIRWSTWTFSTEKLNQNLENNWQGIKCQLVCAASNHYCRLSSRYSPINLLHSHRGKTAVTVLDQYFTEEVICTQCHCEPIRGIQEEHWPIRSLTCIGGYTCRDGQTDHTRNHWWSPLCQDSLKAFHFRTVRVLGGTIIFVDQLVSRC